MHKLYFLFCIFFLFFCTTNKQEHSLHGIWQMCRIQDGKGDLESDKYWEAQFKEGSYVDQLEIINDSVLVHRYKKGNDKWNELKRSYRLSSDKKKIITLKKNDSTTRILLFSADSLKLQVLNKDIQIYFRKKH